MRTTTEAKLQEIVRGVLELPPGTDVTGVGHDTHPAWDSLAHTLLVTAVESEFGLEVDVADSLGLTSYTAFAAYLEARGL